MILSLYNVIVDYKYSIYGSVEISLFKKLFELVFLRNVSVSTSQQQVFQANNIDFDRFSTEPLVIRWV